MRNGGCCYPIEMGANAPTTTGTARAWRSSLGFTLAEIRDLCERTEHGTAPLASLPLTPEEIDQQVTHLEARKRAIEQAIEELTKQRNATLA